MGYESPTRVTAPFEFNEARNSWLEMRPTKKGDSPIPTQFSVITFNTWFSSHRQKERTDALLDILQTEAPTVICLQEVTSTNLNIITSNEFIRRAYIMSDIDGRHFQGYGVVILVSKELADSASFITCYCRPLPSNFCRRVHFVDLKFSCGDVNRILRFVSVHLESSSGAHKVRTDQLKIITTMIKETEEVKNYRVSTVQEEQIAKDADNIHCFFVGDFNFDYDWLLRNGNKCGEYEVLRHCGLKDAWREIRPEEEGYSMPASSGHPAKRIDYVMYYSNKYLPQEISLIGTENISEEKCEKCSISNRVCSPSDHFGIHCKFS